MVEISSSIFWQARSPRRQARGSLSADWQKSPMLHQNNHSSDYFIIYLINLCIKIEPRCKQRGPHLVVVLAARARLAGDRDGLRVVLDLPRSILVEVELGPVVPPEILPVEGEAREVLHDGDSVSHAVAGVGEPMRVEHTGVV